MTRPRISEPPFHFVPSVHKDLTERLEQLDRELWLRVKAVLERNKAERHIRGGEATRIKYKGNEARTSA